VEFFYHHICLITDEKSINLMKEGHKQSRAFIKKVQPNVKVGFSMALPFIDSIPGGRNIIGKKVGELFTPIFRHDK